jgi:adenine-specific DNA-methyltransferase
LIWLFPGVPTTDLFQTPKPEKLLYRVLDIATELGDLVLDSFAGSGTTAAVAHKMGRRWITVELGDAVTAFVVPRLRKVVDGEDPGGVSEWAEWNSGGGFRFFRLAPSLLTRDRWGNWVVNREVYNAERLAEALCKLEGFTYDPSPSTYWMQGRSTESDYIYVTTQTLTHEQLSLISEDVGQERTLLVCCSAFQANLDALPNLTVKKIPASVLARCEWGRDDYSLNVRNVMGEEPEPPPESTETPPPVGRGKRRRDTSVQAMPLFATPGAK